MKKKYKVAIIGTGFGIYGLLPAFKLDKRCEVVAICSIREDINPGMEKLKKINFYNDYIEMVKELNPDIVAIATKPKIQEDILNSLKNMNIHFFCEKSFGVSYARLNKIYSNIDTKKNKTCVYFVYPEIREFKKVKKMIINNKELFHVNVKWFFKAFYNQNSKKNWKKNISEGGGIMHLYGSHVLYYLDFYFGEIDNFVKIKETRKYLKVLINFKSSNKCQIEINTSSDENKHEIGFKSDKKNIILRSSDPLRCDGFQIIKDNKIMKNYNNSLKKGRLNKDLR